MAERIKLVVKPTSGGQKIEVEVDDGRTSIVELKEQLSSQCDIPAADQRLIYKGQILKDERTVESYGIGNDHVLHLVRAKPSGAGQSSTSTPTPATAGGAAAAPTTPAAAAAPAAGGIPNPLGGMMDPNFMQQMMQSPIMQQMLNNPEVLRSMLQMNPAIRDLMDRDPQMAQLLNNPELLRESMQLMSNPNLMREYMRNNDRALSNIEALPGGFNTLRQLYENVQEPLLNATTGSEASNPFAGLLNAAAAGSGAAGAANPPSTSGTGAAAGSAADQPSSQPLPNPWAPQAGGAATGVAPTGLGGSALGAGGMPDLSALLGGGVGGGLGGLGGAGGMGGMAEMTSRMLENPQMRENMIQMMSQPGMMDMIAASNPQLRQMLDAMPGIRHTMQNEELLRMMLNPDFMRAAAGGMQMPGAMGGAGAGAAGSGEAAGAGAGGLNPAMLASMLSGLGGGGAAGGAAGGSAAGPAPEGLLGMFQTMMQGGGMPGFGAPGPAADPATAYATQIQQLQDMGFFDQESNIRALQATGGNVNAAVDRLLQGFP